MQPYQPEQHQPQYVNEQEYQSIPEDQAHPVIFRGRRRHDFFPIIIPFPYPYRYYNYPYYSPYPYPPYPYPYPYYPYGGGFGGY